MSNLYPEATVFNSEVRRLTSSATGQTYQISVWFPPSYADSDKSYPVLYLLDSNTLFGAAANLAMLLSWGGELPETIIVGIGYEIRSYDDWGTLRSHDMTPTTVEDIPGSGGAAQFLHFLHAELIPFIDSSYRTNPADRSITGHSFGGLFVLYALLHRPNLFQRYCAGSPIPDYDDRLLFEFEEEFALRNSALPVSLAVVVGTLEGPNAVSTQEFCANLSARDYEGLKLTFLLLEDETHFSVIAPLMVKGWKAIYA